MLIVTVLVVLCVLMYLVCCWSLSRYASLLNENLNQNHELQEKNSESASLRRELDALRRVCAKKAQTNPSVHEMEHAYSEGVLHTSQFILSSIEIGRSANDRDRDILDALVEYLVEKNSTIEVSYFLENMVKDPKFQGHVKTKTI